MTHPTPPSTSASEVFVFPVSFAQQRLWFLQQLMPDNPFYNVPLAVRLTGELNVAALEQTLQEIVRRHESLRTRFQMVEGELMQVIVPDRSICLETIDLSHSSLSEQQLIDREFQQPLDLEQDVLRVKLLRWSPKEFVLLLTMHHIVTDGWSIGILLREIGTLYAAFAAGKASPLAELPIQYADFACWQRDWLQDNQLTTQLDYWQQQLAGTVPVLDLPIDGRSPVRNHHPRPATPSFRGAQTSLLLPTELSQAIDRLSEASGTTPFMILLAAFQVLLYRYTGQEDVAVGSPIANRNRSEIEGLIGFFVNTLVMRTDLSGNPTFAELLERVREVALGAYAHQDLPFEKLVEVLQPQRDLSHNPLFQVVFALQNAPIAPLELPGLTLSPIDFDPKTARFDLECQVVRSADTLAIVATYSTDLFELSTIDRLLQHFQILLAGIAANPHQSVATLPLLTVEEQHLFAMSNNNQLAYPSDCIHHLFEAQVAKTPNAVAAVFQEEQCTYQQLNDRANQLAHHLRSLGVEPEVLVGVCLARSIEMLVAVLAVLKAGGAYLPLDPSYPPDRLQFMLSDAGVAVLVTQGNLLTMHLRRAIAPCPDGLTPAVVNLDRDTDRIAQLSTANPVTPVTSDCLAYVIYTSGSTGTPKGVLVEHRGLCNLAQAQRQIFDVQPTDRILQFASLSFDASIFEIIMALTAGAALYLPQLDEHLGTNLIQFLQTHQISQATLPPALLRLLPAANLPDLKTVIAAGEACSADLIDRWANNRRLFNAYGLTETTVWATIAKLKPGDAPTIGKPIANTQLYVCDRQGQPVPIGVPGELYIGGDSLARGYLHRPALTVERFVPHPSGAERLYRTGDRVRYRANGDLEFLGRLDEQVKLRGYRIELGEIEAALHQHPQVQSAIVWVRQDRDDQQLVAAVVLHATAPANCPDFREFLRQRLPTYLIPAAVWVRSTLPLTPNGKIDRQAVAADLPASPESRVEPRLSISSTQAKLLELWAENLRLEALSLDDNFFDLGGDSLRAMRLVEQIQQQFDRSLPLSSFFLAPTIRQLATLLEHPELEYPDLSQAMGKARSNIGASLVPLQPLGTKPPFFCVHPILGTVFPYYALARHLGSDQPFYGLQPIGLDGSQPPHTQIEAMAAHYIEEMQQVQPHSPYYIGGWSFGGLVAFEMAQQLRQAGQRVALLAIFDTTAPGSGQALGFREGLRFFSVAGRSILPFLLDYGSLVTASLPQFWQRGLRSARNSRPEQLPQQTRHQLLNELSVRAMLRVYEANVQAALSYVPSLYPEPIALFKTQNQIQNQTRQKPSAQSGRDAALGWRELTNRAVEVHQISGNHLTMLREPHVQSLGRQLQRCLAREEAAPLLLAQKRLDPTR